MIKYNVEKMFDIVEELKTIIPEHYDELSVTKGYELDPDWDRYFHLEQAKSLCVITCRQNDILIGYIIFFVTPHLHYKQCLTAFEDIYFIKKEFRKGRIGIQLFKYAEEYLKSIGVNRIMYSTKVHLDNSRIFEYLGYTFIEKLYSKLI